MVDNYQTETLCAATFGEGDASSLQHKAPFSYKRAGVPVSGAHWVYKHKGESCTTGGNARIKQGKECGIQRSRRFCQATQLRVKQTMHFIICPSPVMLPICFPNSHSCFPWKGAEITSLHFGFGSRILDGKYQTPYFPCSIMLFFNEVIDIPFLWVKLRTIPS